MSWRGSVSPSDRIFSCLAYVLPLLNVLGLTGPIIVGSGSFLAPLLLLIFIPLQPLFSLYYALGGIVSFIIFIALFMLVVRNEAIAYFIRFNVMQAILLGIALSLFSIVWQYILAAVFPPTSIITQTLFNTVFLATIAAVGYSIVQSAIGRFAEIPTISNAVRAQLPY
jgi:hypothetical protein